MQTFTLVVMAPDKVGGEIKHFCDAFTWAEGGKVNVHWHLSPRITIG